MTLSMKQWVRCPRCYLQVPNEQPFDTWCRSQPLLHSVTEGVVCFDNDLIVHRYKFDGTGKEWQCLMFVEVKSFEADMGPSQRDTLGIWSQLMDNMRLANPGEIGPCFRVWSTKKDGEVFLRSYGVHCLRFDRSTPDDSTWIEWDWKYRITREQVIGLMRFDLDPDDPNITLSMDERFKRTKKPAILTKGNGNEKQTILAGNGDDHLQEDAGGD